MGIDHSSQTAYKPGQNQCFLKTVNSSSSFYIPLQNIEVEAHTSEKLFRKRIVQMQNYLAIISQKSQLDIQDIKGRFWLPFKYEYYPNKYFCSPEDGRAVLKFDGGYQTLFQQMSSRSFNNDPFTASQLWKLLYVLSDSILLFKNSLPNFVLNSDNILVNTSTTKIKFSTPFSQFQDLLKRNHQNPISNISFLNHKNVNTKDCFLFSPDKRSDDFDLGIIIAECLLLESCQQIYEQQMNQQFINHTRYSEMIKKILKNKLYPIKIKIVVVGLLQLLPEERFTCQELIKLLQTQRNKIIAQDTFHLHKTAFSNCFGSKLKNIEKIINQIKIQYQCEKFKKGIITLDYRQQIKQNCIKIGTSTLPQSKEPLFQGSHFTNTQSLNFSISNIHRATKRGEDTQSLVWSKSQMRSTPQQQILTAKNEGGLSDEAKSQRNKSERQINNPFTANSKIKIEEPSNTNINTIHKNLTIDDIFDDHPQENNQLPIIKKAESYQIQDKTFQMQKTPIEDIFANFAPENTTLPAPHQQSKFSHNNTPIFHRIEDESPQKEIEQKKSSINSNNLNRSTSEPSHNIIKQLNFLQKQSPQKQKKQISSIQNILTASTKQIKPRIPISRRISQRKMQSNPVNTPQMQNSPTNFQKVDQQKQNSQVAQYKSYLYEVQPPQIDINTSGIQFKQPQAQNPSELRQIFMSQSSQSPKKKEDLFPLEKSPEPKQNMYSSCLIVSNNKGLKTGDSIIQGLTNLMSSTKSQKQFSAKNDTPIDLVRQSTKKEEYMNSFKKFPPQLIASLSIRSIYPEDQNFKRLFREKMSINEMAINKSRQLFPEHQYPSPQKQAV